MLKSEITDHIFELVYHNIYASRNDIAEHAIRNRFIGFRELEVKVA